MRHPRTDMGASTVLCLLCEQVGVIKAFRNLANLSEHLAAHDRGQVVFTCSRCGNVPVSVDGVTHSCAAERSRRRPREDDEHFGEVAESSVLNEVHGDMCPKCGCVLSGSVFRQMDHVVNCRGAAQSDVVLNDGDLIPDAEQEVGMLEEVDANSNSQLVLHARAASRQLQWK
jgi:hypothetical protein